MIANNTSYDNDGPEITMGGNNCIVIGNRCWNNARLSGVVGGSGIVARAHPRLPNAASGSVFIANSCFDTRPRSAMTQAYGYNEVGNGFKDIKHFGNDYNPNKVGATKLQAQGEFAEHLQVSTEIKNRLSSASPKMRTCPTLRVALPANISPNRKDLNAEPGIDEIWVNPCPDEACHNMITTELTVTMAIVFSGVNGR